MSCKNEFDNNGIKKSLSVFIEHSLDILDYDKIHQHDVVEVVYMIRGEVDLLIDFSLYKIKKGDCVVINSGVYHAICSSGKQNFEFLKWSFLPEYIYSFEKDIYNIELFLWLTIKSSNTYLIIDSVECPEIEELFFSAFDRFLKQEYCLELMLHADTLSLCLLFFNMWHKENEEFIRNISGISISEIRKVLLFIEENYNSLSFGEISKIYDVKNVVFSKNFKMVTGYRVSEYIDFLRIKKAMFLLSTTTESLTSIAVIVGYSTAAFFSKKFREFYGISPTEFRRGNMPQNILQKEKEKTQKSEQTETRLYFDSILASVFYERFVSSQNGKFPFFRIFYMDKGSIDIECSDVVYNLEKGDVFLVCPNEKYSITSNSTEKKSLFMIDFYPEFLNFGKENSDLCRNLIYYTQYFKRHFSVCENDSTIMESLSKLNIARIERNINFELVLRVNIIKIVVWILKNQNGKCETISLENTDVFNENMKQILEYVDAHYMEHINLKEISERFFVSYSHLSRMFKRAIGTSFNDYIQNKKLLQATFMLITTDKTAREISKKLSYCSHGYFIELFAKRMHMTPTEFRRRFKNKEPLYEYYRHEYYEN